MGIIYGIDVIDASHEVVDDTPRLEGKLYADILLKFVMIIDCGYHPYLNQNSILKGTEFVIQIGTKKQRQKKKIF